MNLSETIELAFPKNAFLETDNPTKWFCAPHTYHQEEQLAKKNHDDTILHYNEH